MVTHRPNQFGPFCILLNLAQTGLARLEFLDDAGLCVPSDTRKPTDAGAVKCVTVVDDGLGLELSDGPEQTLERRAADAWPEVRVTEHNHHAVLNAKLDPSRMIVSCLQVVKLSGFWAFRFQFDVIAALN